MQSEKLRPPEKSEGPNLKVISAMAHSPDNINTGVRRRR